MEKSVVVSEYDSLSAGVSDVIIISRILGWCGWWWIGSVVRFGQKISKRWRDDKEKNKERKRVK